MTPNHAGDVVLTTAQIQQGVQTVAQQLNTAFQGEEAVVLTVVPGGILFTADLVRALTFPVCMDTLSCPHTPGDRHNTSDIVYHPHVSITDKHVIIIDDAIESGGTMKRLVEYVMTGFNVKSLSVATLFVKPGRVAIPVPQYFAYEMINDDLLMGYGLPWKHYSRNLSYIAKVNR
ncbi:hypoxanthine phosphoribosyltransferase [Photobacterium japonica]|uniref:phosphoribosyltransferase n=1 Tax=Photobacterium japonica TaxID=2910235 RepID=UPI003D14A615